jgi:hypothetical protein
MLELAHCCASVTDGSIEDNKTAVHLLGQVINDQVTLGVVDSRVVVSLDRLRLNQSHQHFQVATFPGAAFQVGPQLEFGTGRQRAR